MLHNGKIYLAYDGNGNVPEGYFKPVVIRYSKKDSALECAVYIDGKPSKEVLSGKVAVHGKPYSIALLSATLPSDRMYGDYKLVASKFNPGLQSDWECIFKDAVESHRNGDTIAYAFMLIAFDRFEWNADVIEGALNSFYDKDKEFLLECIDYCAWSMSPNKMGQIKVLCKKFGKISKASYPQLLGKAAEDLGVKYDNLNVHSLADIIFSCDNNKEGVKSTNNIHPLIKWINDDAATISADKIKAVFPYLGESMRSIVVKRFFYDIKNGRLQYTDKSPESFSGKNYSYYSRMRYILEKYPEPRNVSTEFLFDCLDTYKKTGQTKFQVNNGILDWALAKSKEIHRPVDLRFSDWLSFCKGGVLLNSRFKGFAEFEIQYELFEPAFDEETLKLNAITIFDRYSTRLRKEVRRPTREIDMKTGLPVIDNFTGKPKMVVEVIDEDSWDIGSPEDDRYPFRKKLIDIFVNWDMRPATETRANVFTIEMVDYKAVCGKVEKYLIEKFGTLAPYISLRKHDDIVKLFMCETRMRAKMVDDARIGEFPGVDEAVVWKRIKERLTEIFGETLEYPYDAAKLREAKTDTQYSEANKDDVCFIKAHKTYRGYQTTYCAPTLSEFPTFLTDKKCAICTNDMCFVTSVRKDPPWREYKLIHILEILGYNVIEDTEAGYMTSKVYNQFVNQINKAIRFYKRLTCRECGHILFPSNLNGYNRFKCELSGCKEFGKEVYLNWCHECRVGLIDSRNTKQCPNELYICPRCNACCSNALFESIALKYERSGSGIPRFLSKKMGNGHADRGMVFCAKCGMQKVKSKVPPYVYSCPRCDKDEN